MASVMVRTVSDGVAAYFEPGSSTEPWMSSLSILLGILMCKWVYSAMQAWSLIYLKAYRNLSRMQRMEWDNRGFSTAHALIATFGAGYLLFISDFYKAGAPYGPIVFRSSPLSQSLLGISCGYFLSDLAMILRFFPGLGGTEFIIHHLLSLISIGLSIRYREAQFYIIIVLFSEMTTPFVNLRWYLNASGLKDSRAYYINGFLLFFGWLMARVILFVYFFVHFYHHYDQIKMVFAPGYYFLFIAPPGLFFMNIFWFFKLARGLVRALTKSAL